MIILLFFIFLLYPTYAFSYIDPGIVSLILNSIFAFLAAITGYIIVYFKKFKIFLKKLKIKIKKLQIKINKIKY